MSKPPIVGDPLPDHYGSWSNPPWAIIVHFSAGYTARQCSETLKKRGLSVHASIERDGTVYRHVEDNHRAIHAGYGRWQDVSNMNHHALGFEIINFGWVDGEYTDDVDLIAYDNDKKHPDDPELLPDEDGRVWYREEMYGGKPYAILTRTTCKDFPDHRHSATLGRGQVEGKEDIDDLLWSTYPRPQQRSVLWLCIQWMKKYDILPENVVGHEHVTPHKKMDPGPAFRWQLFDRFVRRRLSKVAPHLVNPEHNSPLRLKAVQSHLQRLGVYGYSVDGKAGSGTRAGLRKAVESWGEVYDFEYDPDSDDWMHISTCLKTIPGFDTGRS